MRRPIGIILLIVGLLCIGYPFYMEYEQNKEVRALEEAMSLIMSADEGEEVDLSAIENLPFTEDEIRNVMELEIPYLDIRHKVLEETTPHNLNLALTQIKENQTPGEGNFTIAGHRGYRDGRHFSNLAEVPIGEVVYLHVQDRSYVYEIVSSDVIEATDVHVLDDRDGIDELTLITCTISGKQRVAVRAKLIDTLHHTV